MELVLILLIDNYDSFTFNLARYFEEIGEQVLVARNDEVNIAEIEALAPDALVFSPGPCTPDSSGVTLEAIKAFHKQIPMLGVCLGHQALAQVFGARIVRAEKVMHGKVSRIVHSGKGVFDRLPDMFDVTRYHSLVVEPESLPQDFEIVAWTNVKGRQVKEIMAIQHKKWPISGVQFHPESLLTEYGHDLLRNFIDNFVKGWGR